ncbi:transposon Tf2-9 polyprotein [Trichonephila clavipes]|nr:transposon Tf2-9 polyprotein [Trichonephila clavipes]
MLVTSDELTYKIVNAQESDEYIKAIKKLWQEGKTSEFIVSNKILYKISEDQEFLVVPEMISKEFEDRCADEQISNVQITTGVPRGNGQVERIHGVLIPVLTKMSIEDPTKWFKHIDSLQRVLNSLPSRRTKYSLFELLIGVKMKNPEDVMIRNLLEEENQEQLFQHRDNLRREAKQNILKIQEENRRTYNRKRKEAHQCKKGDLVAIMRTQFGNKLKLRIKYFGPYQVTKVKLHDRYDVAKIGDHEGPNVTSASADQMTP